MSELKIKTEPTQEMLDEWATWVAGRPLAVRAIAERFPPWIPYRLTTTGQVCRVQAFSENGTVRIVAEHPLLGAISRRGVLGIDPDTLVPWEEGDESRPFPSSAN